MKIKTFSIREEAEANEFINSVVVLQESGVQVTSEGRIVVFYEETKDAYNEYFVRTVIDNLKRNLFHEQIAQKSAKAEYDFALSKAGTKSDKSPEARTAREKERNLVTKSENIELIESKIATYEAWITENTSNK